MTDVLADVVAKREKGPMAQGEAIWEPLLLESALKDAISVKVLNGTPSHVDALWLGRSWF